MARAVAVDTAHHVTQRGNGRQAVFFTERDREVYLDAFFDHAARYGLRVWGYCLLNNHVHFVVVPEREGSLSRVFGRTHSDYARYSNLARRSCGHLWQARFYSCALDGYHAWQALAYVERNPVRARLVNAAEEYRWSTAAAHWREGKPGRPGTSMIRVCQGWGRLDGYERPLPNGRGSDKHPFAPRAATEGSGYSRTHTRRTFGRATRSPHLNEF